MAQVKAKVDALGVLDRGPRNTANLKWVVLHTTENAAGTPAMNIIQYQNNTRSGSYNIITDTHGNSVRHNDDNYSPWSVAGTRGDYEGLHVSMAFRAGSTRAQWLAQDALLEETARIVAGWCKSYGIPVKRLTQAELRANQKGIIDHNDCSKVFGRTDHWDVGPNFPWDIFLQKVNRHITPPAAPPTAPKPDTPKPPKEDEMLERLHKLFTDKHKTLVKNGTFATTLGHFILLIDAATYRTERKVDHLNAKLDELLESLKKEDK